MHAERSTKASMTFWTAWHGLHEAGDIQQMQWNTDQEEAFALRRLRHPGVRWVPPSPPWLPDAMAVLVLLLVVVGNLWVWTR